ncbi:hypothetical protein E2C01_032247 [Portunus trituberculatus]|uniref:Uncharacterized protein n=1 Tax=Portunus trituberculatus TaxID=210409 RepID=A0A5B7F0U5_PORTR|nr:hypothetical protein [Portunus trituberculatus]
MRLRDSSGRHRRSSLYGYPSSTLLPSGGSVGGMRPRVNKLQTLEAKWLQEKEEEEKEDQ